MTLVIENTNVTVNDLVTIECRMVEKGRPEAKISWYHNNELLPDKNDRYLFNRGEVELKDSGSYKCVAENNAGISESKVKNLIVNKKPGEGREKVLNFNVPVTPNFVRYFLDCIAKNSVICGDIQHYSIWK